MLPKSLIQLSVDWWSCVPFLLFTWDQTMVEVMKITVTSFKRSHACTATVPAPNPAAGHCQPMPSAETPRQPQASLLWDHCSFLLGPGTQGSVVGSQESRKSRNPGVTGKFGIGVRNEAGQRLTEFCQGNALVIAKHSLPTT